MYAAGSPATASCVPGPATRHDAGSVAAGLTTIVNGLLRGLMHNKGYPHPGKFPDDSGIPIDDSWQVSAPVLSVLLQHCDHFLTYRHCRFRMELPAFALPRKSPFASIPTHASSGQNPLSGQPLYPSTGGNPVVGSTSGQFLSSAAGLSQQISPYFLCGGSDSTSSEVCGGSPSEMTS